MTKLRVNSKVQSTVVRPGPVFERGVEALQLFADFGRAAEPVFSELSELSLELRAAHPQ